MSLSETIFLNSVLQVGCNRKWELSLFVQVTTSQVVFIQHWLLV